MNYLITIIGPTAIGKTSLAIQLAKHFNSEIISCDSRQFFKEMRIGTAVPDDSELNAIKHHFIQNISIHNIYNVGDFENDALKKLDELFQKNNIQIMVGGSGLYIDAVIKGFDEFPEIEPNIRTQINNTFDRFGIEYLQKQLQNLDSEYYNKISKENPQTLQNPQRMKRFVEVCIGSGKPYSSYLGKRINKRNFSPILIGLEADREKMYERINSRVDFMLESGLLNEVENLVPYKNLNALQTVGYKELFDYLDNIYSLEFAIEEIKKNTRRFAKRQMTWFKKYENVYWFDYKTPIEEIIYKINI
jgi:tRNA dimethylallyltransferase